MDLTFLQCIYLFYDLIKHNIIQQDPNDPNHILIYCAAGDPQEEYPEGWYSENILDVASELVNDSESQKTLTDMLAGFNKSELTYLNPALNKRLDTIGEMIQHMEKEKK